MKQLPATPDVLAAARRIIWFKPPEQALKSPIELMTYAMRYATPEDMRLLIKHVGKAGLTETIDAKLPGIVDARSWAYWNLKIGRTPPPLPKRHIPG
jgi:hypothetical protein